MIYVLHNISQAPPIYREKHKPALSEPKQDDDKSKVGYTQRRGLYPARLFIYGANIMALGGIVAAQRAQAYQKVLMNEEETSDALYNPVILNNNGFFVIVVISSRFELRCLHY